MVKLGLVSQSGQGMQERIFLFLSRYKLAHISTKVSMEATSTQILKNEVLLKNDGRSSYFMHFDNH